MSTNLPVMKFSNCLIAMSEKASCGAGRVPPCAGQLAFQDVACSEPERSISDQDYPAFVLQETDERERLETARVACRMCLEQKRSAQHPLLAISLCVQVDALVNKPYRHASAVE